MQGRIVALRVSGVSWQNGDDGEAQYGLYFWACILVGIGVAMSDALTQRPLNVAHRGGAGLAPETTLAAFRQALALKVDAVELDLHLSQDSVPVVIHDPDVSRTTDGRGQVGALTLAELRSLNAAAHWTGEALPPQPIPTLDEVLHLVRGHVAVQIEIKRRADQTRYAGIEAAVLEAVRRHRMLDQVHIISFDFPTLLTIKKLAPTVQTCALASAYLKRFDARSKPQAVVHDLVRHGFDCVGVQFTRLTKPLFDALRARRFRIGVWTVNDASVMRQFVDLSTWTQFFV
jgi:glycerophosphoryl diester phosphodiesterase